MNKTERYLEAARRLAEDEEEYSCVAIGHLVYSYGSTSLDQIPEVKAYCAVFNANSDFDLFADYVINDKDPKNLRVMMTCLMAVCWQDFK